MAARTNIREKRHRLPRECYRGRVRASFTLCIEDRKRCFTESTVVNTFLSALQSILEKRKVNAPGYCFMPNHCHLILEGEADDSDLWATVVEFKQHTGFWFRTNSPHIRWQKDFYDHIIRENENLKDRVAYVLNNPVRQGIVDDWTEYPYKGSIGVDLEDVIS